MLSIVSDVTEVKYDGKLIIFKFKDPIDRKECNMPWSIYTFQHILVMQISNR